MPIKSSSIKTIERFKYLKDASYLKMIYQFWYHQIFLNLPPCSEKILELGSGGGFLKKIIPNIITSDILMHAGIDKKINAHFLPFQNRSLSAIVGTNVLHHISQIWKFFEEAERTLQHKGKLIFIEPWHTALSKPIYRYLHHEPFDVHASWEVKPGDPLDSANGALPWIIFFRDQIKFKKNYPSLTKISIKTFMPFSYLVSGGIERRWPLASWFFPLIRALEKPFDFLGLFALIVVEKNKS